jgi:hypothetical protein
MLRLLFAIPSLFMVVSACGRITGTCTGSTAEGNGSFCAEFVDAAFSEDSMRKRCNAIKKDGVATAFGINSTCARGSSGSCEVRVGGDTIEERWYFANVDAGVARNICADAGGFYTAQ